MKPRFPLGGAIAYSIGQLGWSIVIGIIINFLVYFYLPPEGAGLPRLIPEIYFFGFISIIGIITMGGRLLDAITDPWIASLSDRSSARMGRRISFMAIGALPMVVLMFLVFYTPHSTATATNLLWLTFTIFFFYIFFTVYQVPYTALVAERGHTPQDRLNLCTYISITYFVGQVISAQAPIMFGLFQNMFDLSRLEAVRLTFGLLGLLALVCLYVPVFLVDENKFSIGKPTSVPLAESLKMTFRNKSFVVFAVSDLIYWVFMTLLQTGLIYYATVLLRQPEDYYSMLFILLMGGSFICYPFVNLLAKKAGKKTVLVFSLCLFALSLLFTSQAGQDWILLPLPLQGYLLVLMAFFPLAAYGILPNAIVADIAENDALRTGSHREAIFFGARSFMMKLGQMVAMLIFTSLLVFGRDIGDDLGIRLTALTGVGFCMLSLVFLYRYNEKHLLEESTRLKTEQDSMLTN